MEESKTVDDDEEDTTIRKETVDDADINIDDTTRKESVKKDSKKQKEESILMTKEEKNEGFVSWRVYVRYMGEMGWPVILLVVLSLLGKNALLVVTDVWLAKWSTAKNQDEATYYMTIYAIFGLSIIFVSLLYYLSWVYGGLIVAKRLFVKMLKTLIRVPTCT